MKCRNSLLNYPLIGVNLKCDEEGEMGFQRPFESICRSKSSIGETKIDQKLFARRGARIMIKSKLRLFGWAVGLSLALGAVGAVAAQGAPVEAEAAAYTGAWDYEWAAAKGDPNKFSGTSGTAALGGVTWNYTQETDNFKGLSSQCVQLGKGNASNGAVTLSYTPSKAVKAVRVETSSKSGSSSLSITIGGTGYLASTSTATWTTVGALGGQELTTPLSGEIVLSWTASSAALYIKTIQIAYLNDVPVTGVTLDKSSADLYKATADNTVTLKPTVSPSGATVKTVSWSTTNSNVATVAGGVVTAVNPGTATITVTTTDGSKTATCAITVWSATALAISNPPESGVKTHYLAGDDPDHNGLVATVTWSNSSTTKQEDVSSKATWNDSGAIGAEDESVLFSAAYAGVNDEFELPIEVAAEAKYPESVSLSYADTTLYVGESQNASTGYLPNDANQLDFGFSSSDATVLSVDSDGTVHALKAGNASITYFSDYDGKRDTVKATVDFTVENVPPTGITLSASSGSISEDAEGTLDFTVTVEGSPTIPGYNVSVTDATIVTASKNGDTVSLTPKKAGSTTVVISSIGTPVKSATYTVTVTAIPRYTLVTDITQLTIGNKVIVTDTDHAAAMNAYASGNNCGKTAVTEETTNVIKKAASFTSLTIGADENGYTLKDENDNYLYAASSSSNYLKGTKSLDQDGNDHWSISIDPTTKEASIVAQGSNTHNIMRYNSTSSLFACYASGQKAIKLYVLDTAPTAVDKVATFSQLYMHPEVKTSDKGDGKCITENWFTTAKAAIDGDWSSIAADFAASGDMWTRFVNWGAAQTPKVVITYDNGIKYNANYLTGRLITENKGSKIAMVAAFAGIGALAVGGMVFLRKRKEF